MNILTLNNPEKKCIKHVTKWMKIGQLIYQEYFPLNHIATENIKMVKISMWNIGVNSGKQIW